MNREREALIKELKHSELKIETLIKKNYDFKCPKSLELSEISRKKGNELFVQDNHDDKTHKEILTFYCESVLQASDGSEHLALAYGNRSAFLFHTEKYEHCIIDIDRALSITNHAVLKIKLLCRKAQCLKALGLEEYKKALKEAKSAFVKISKKSEDKKTLIKLLEAADKCRFNICKTIVEDYSELSPKAAAYLNCKDISKVQDSIKIERNKEYGRYISANKDFAPGEIIFVDKPFANPLLTHNFSTCCQNCLKFCWSGIPCDKCAWATFCNEQCKKEAWERFHEIECHAVTNEIVKSDSFINQACMKFRMLLAAIKEYQGDIAKLKKEINDVVNSTSDSPYKGFRKDGKIQSCSTKGVVTLSSYEEESIGLKKQAENVIPILVYLAKYTNIFGIDFELKKVEDFVTNDDVIFLGTLYIKFDMVIRTNMINVLSYEHFCSSMSYGHKSVTNTCSYNKCCSRACATLPLYHLFNHSCFPNAGTCFTRDFRLVVYASLPIKKGSQIFVTYGHSYHNKPILPRMLALSLTFGFDCKCIACKGEWPVLGDIEPKTSFEDNLLRTTPVAKVHGEGITDFTLKDIKLASTSLEKGLKAIKLPSGVIWALMQTLKISFAGNYGFRPPVFGACKNH